MSLILIYIRLFEIYRVSIAVVANDATVRSSVLRMLPRRRDLYRGLIIQHTGVGSEAGLSIDFLTSSPLVCSSESRLSNRATAFPLHFDSFRPTSGRPPVIYAYSYACLPCLCENQLGAIDGHSVHEK